MIAREEDEVVVVAVMLRERFMVGVSDLLLVGYFDFELECFSKDVLGFLGFGISTISLIF